MWTEVVLGASAKCNDKMCKVQSVPPGVCLHHLMKRDARFPIHIVIMMFNSKGNFGGYKRISHQLDLPIILSVQEECFLSTTPKELSRDSEIILITLYEAKVHLGIELAFISTWGERKCPTWEEKQGIYNHRRR